MMTKLEQTVFALSEASEHRALLKQVLKETTQSVKTITDLNPQALYDQGLRVIVFDFDGVLTPHGDLTVVDPELTHLRTFCEVFHPSNIIIWSNNPIPARMRFIQQHFPEVEWLDGKQKPYPDSLQQLIQTKSCEPQTVLLIDDRLLTGILAGLLAGTKVCLVKKPKIRLKGNFKIELGFMLLRLLEQLAFRF